MNPGSERKRLLRDLRRAADPAYREGAPKILKTGLKMLGVRVPELRRVARAFRVEHADAPWEEVLEVVDALWESDLQDERLLAILITGYYARRIPELRWEHFDRWRGRLENWGLTDALATIVLGPWVQASMPARLRHLRALVRDEDLWSRRLAIVATVLLNRGRKAPAIPDVTFALLDRVKAERDPMMTKAVSWALRELVKTHPDRVEAYLEENRGALAALVAREVKNKLRTGRKSGRA